MSTAYHKPATELTKRLRALNRKADKSFDGYYHATPSSRNNQDSYIDAAKEAIASTAFQRHQLIQATNNIQQIIREKKKEKKQRAEEIALRSNSKNNITASSVHLLSIEQKKILRQAAKTTSVISTSRQKEIIEMAADDAKTGELIDALDYLISERFSSNENTKKLLVFVPDEFCELLMKCCMKKVSSCSSFGTAEKLFDRYCDVMSVDQRVRFGFDLYFSKKKSSSHHNDDSSKAQEEQLTGTSLEDFISSRVPSVEERVQYAPFLLKRLIKTKMNNNNNQQKQMQKQQWQAALESLSCIIPSKEFLTPTLSATLLERCTTTTITSSSSSSSSKMSITGPPTSLTDVRKVLDVVCTSKPSLVKEIELWNSYLEQILKTVMVVYGQQQKNNALEEDTEETEEEDIIGHVLDLVEVNMPHYKVVPTIRTIELVVEIVLAKSKSSTPPTKLSKERAKEILDGFLMNMKENDVIDDDDIESSQILSSV